MKRLCAAVATMTKCVPMEHAFVQEVFINHLGPKSGKHQFSLNNIRRLSRVKDMRSTN